MDHGLSEQLMYQLSERLAEQMGLHFPQERWCELKTVVRRVARELRISDMAAWINSLQSARLTRSQIEVLAGALTTGETYFMREKPALAALRQYILPELIRARRDSGRRLRIWSAGCCTGEEPYSIAILLERILPDLCEWDVTILATDVNPRFLRVAEQGTYSEWSFRDAPSWLKENYFKSVAGHRYAILPRIHERVKFAYLNLGERSYPSLANDTQAMDLILCRNVLMYFSPETAARVVANFHRSLVGGGWLLVGAVETSAGHFSGFVARQLEGAICYQKKEPVFAPGFDFDIPMPLTREPARSSESAIELHGTPLAAVQDDLQVPPSACAAAPYGEALTLFEQGRYLEAAEKLASDRAVARSVEGLSLTAKIHANLGDLAQAQRCADQAVAVDKVNNESHYLRAMILQERGLLEDALVSLRRALYLSPDFILGHFALGSLVRRQGECSQARRHFRNALALLRECDDAEVLPCSDGMPVKQLRETIECILRADFAA
jgi:chemotaxis protein methyltransferase CheR